MFQSELHRVGVSRRGELVDEALVGVGVLHPPWRADPGGAKRRRCKPPADRLDVSEFVRDRRVLENVARRDVIVRRHFRERRCDQRYEEGSRLLRNVELRLPCSDAARAINRRRTFRVPAVLVGARPLHPHRPPGRFRQQRRVRGGILVPVAAVAAGAFDVDAAYAVRVDAKHRCELFAQVVRRLRGRPGGQLPILELRHRAGRPDRAVGVDGEIVSGLDRLGAGAA